MTTSICKAIDCPYFSKSSQNYGCQFYAKAEDCHLAKLHSGILRSTEYELFADDPTEDIITQLRTDNDKYLRESPKYEKDAAFQQSHPDFGVKFPTRLL